MKKERLAKSPKEFDRRFDAGEDVHMDLSQYRVRVGVAPGVYTNTYNTGVKSMLVGGLTSGTRHYVGGAVLDQVSLEGMITELSGVPRLVPLSPAGLTAMSAPRAVSLKWRKNHEVDLRGYHLYRRNGTAEVCFRFCGERIQAREELGLPEKMDDLARKPNGLVLITGPARSGKTTTLNYLVDLINSERRCKIVTIEDPIEFVHRNNRAIIVHQEVHTDTCSFDPALLHVLRQDPHVIVVGEMPSSETCNTYNMLKLTRHLFSWSPSAETMDFYERGLYNHILASQDPATGGVTYYCPLKPGASAPTRPRTTRSGAAPARVSRTTRSTPTPSTSTTTRRSS